MFLRKWTCTAVLGIRGITYTQTVSGQEPGGPAINGSRYGSLTTMEKGGEGA